MTDMNKKALALLGLGHMMVDLNRHFAVFGWWQYRLWSGSARRRPLFDHVWANRVVTAPAPRTACQRVIALVFTWVVADHECAADGSSSDHWGDFFVSCRGYSCFCSRQPRRAKKHH